MPRAEQFAIYLDALRLQNSMDGDTPLAVEKKLERAADVVMAMALLEDLEEDLEAALKSDPDGGQAPGLRFSVPQRLEAVRVVLDTLGLSFGGLVEREP